MPSPLGSLLVLFAAAGTAYYQLKLKDQLVDLGIWRTPESRGTERCTLVPELAACEKIVLHQPTGLLYAACSTLEARAGWMPTLHRYNASVPTQGDYIATYDSSTSRITRLTVDGLDDPRGLSLHGMDVVPDARDPRTLWMYVVNHRAPVSTTGRRSDPAIEVFRTDVGARKISHVQTYTGPEVLSPNDIVGASDGKSFWFTNDGTHHQGLAHVNQVYFGSKRGSIGFCSEGGGCKIATDHLPGPNGLTRPSENVFVVSSMYGGKLRVLERQADVTLAVTDFIKLDMPVDNLSSDKDGVVWGAGMTNVVDIVFKHFEDPSQPVGSTAIRISFTGNRSAPYDEKYNIDKPFESDGKVASGTSTVVYDTERRLLFFSGLVAHGLTVCDRS